jgi:hypothetical protein
MIVEAFALTGEGFFLWTLSCGLSTLDSKTRLNQT